jgi:acetoin utilization protein AcuB
MTTRVVTVEMDTGLREVKEVFDNVDFHHLLVVDEGVLFGVISDRDLLYVLSPKVGTVAETNADIADLNKRAHQIMTRQPVTLGPNATVKAAIDMFNTHKISCIPVVDTENRPVGIVSWRDILKTL